MSSVDVLRGLASAAVVWFHFTGLLPPGWLQRSGSYGWLGVDVFFVISGFIIPYALYRGGYTLQRYPRFLAKRIIRLDPPYLVSVALAIAGIYIGTALSHGPPDPRLTLPGILLHIGYLNFIAGYPWLNDAYWTLAVEFQYYLLMGLLFPALGSSRGVVRWLTLAALGGLCFLIPANELIFRYLWIFMAGIVTFQARVDLIRSSEYWVLLVVSIGGTWFSLGSVHALAAASAIAVLQLDQIKNRPLLFLGEISYSLYLLHASTGWFVILLLRGWGLAETLLGQIATLASACALAITSAWLLYWLVERPSRKWSSRIRYNP